MKPESTEDQPWLVHPDARFAVLGDLFVDRLVGGFVCWLVDC